MKRFIKNNNICFVFISSLLFFSCFPDEVTDGNGLTDPDLDASFNITQVNGKNNTYLLTSNSTQFITSSWNIDDGIYKGSETEIFLPDAGTYTVSHTVTGIGGDSVTDTQEIQVETSDPASGNILQGGRFETEEDFEKWEILTISSSGASWFYTPEYITISAADWNQQGIFQKVEVQANKEYKIDMKVWGSGATDTWFEVFVSKTPPVQNSDYSADGIRMGLNTWNGCATSAFEGKLSSVGCAGSGNVVSFDEDGSVYLVIKCGGSSTGSTGISVDNIEMRGVS